MKSNNLHKASNLTNEKKNNESITEIQLPAMSDYYTKQLKAQKMEQ